MTQARPRTHAPAVLAALLAAALPATALAQALDLGASQPGQPPTPIQITASQGIELQQKSHVVIATGNATAVRGPVTVKANSLVAHYRPKQAAPGAAPAAPAAGGSDSLSGLDTGSSEIYELEAIGNVHIYTATDNAWGDHAVYLQDQNLLTLTGHALKLTTPTEIVTARDSIQYFTQAHKAVANGNAVATDPKDGRSVSADKLTAYFQPTGAAPGAQPGAQNPATQNPAAQKPGAAPDAADSAEASKLKRVEAEGHVVIRTATEVAFGDTGDYDPETGIAHLHGHVRITRGPNEMMGSNAVVNMKSGEATLLAGTGGQVAGTVVPNSAPDDSKTGDSKTGDSKTGASKTNTSKTNTSKMGGGESAGGPKQ